jgi:hypothetical protein
MRPLSTAQAAHCLGIVDRNAPVVIGRLAAALGISVHVGRGRVQRWSPGQVVAMAVLRALEADSGTLERWADGAALVGDAFDGGERATYLIVAADGECKVVLDELGARNRHVGARIVRDVTRSAEAVRIVRLRPILDRVESWIAEHAA